MRFCKYCGAPLDEVAPQPPRFEADLSAPAPQPDRPSERSTQRTQGTERANVGFASPTPSGAPVTANRLQTGRLVVIVEDGSEGKSFPLEDRQLDVGRVEGDILLPDDLYVSPRHARLLPVGGSVGPPRSAFDERGLPSHPGSRIS